MNFCPNNYIYQWYLFWPCSLPCFPLSLLYMYSVLPPRDTCPLLLWCFTVMSLGVFQGCTSCCAVLHTFLSVSDSKEEYPRLLIMLKSVLQRSELESVSFYCPSQPEANILWKHMDSFKRSRDWPIFRYLFKKSCVFRTTGYLENNFLEYILPIFVFAFSSFTTLVFKQWASEQVEVQSVCLQSHLAEFLRNAFYLAFLGEPSPLERCTCHNSWWLEIKRSDIKKAILIFH